ncbi:MAG: 50S ribosomal protein L4 [Dehalococcoidia bacterium]|nr:MAG: 50S ribosomal protein L4 [Dehalococcoidia bacterium]
MKVSVHNTKGNEIEQIELDESVFGVPPNDAVVHQALVRQRANARVGTASTKTRGEVSGSTRKLFRQKHTGFARAGSRRPPTRRGGGIAFGPRPRSYNQAMPKKMRRLALKCMLSAKLAEDELKVIDSFGLKQPDTKQMLHILSALGIDSSVLVVTDDPDVNVIKSARNLPKVKTLPATMLNVVDLLSHRKLLMSVEAVRKAEATWGQKQVVAEAQAS